MPRKHSLHAYVIDPETSCWIWQGNTIWNGYGVGAFPGYHGVAHRWHYEQRHGPIPEGMQLDHLCRNRRCVNPDHLEPVTHRENARRGKQTILTIDQVREIKRASRERGSGRRLAAEYGVHECTISAIRHGRLWPEVT